MIEGRDSVTPARPPIMGVWRHEKNTIYCGPTKIAVGILANDVGTCVAKQSLDHMIILLNRAGYQYLLDTVTPHQEIKQ